MNHLFRNEQVIFCVFGCRNFTKLYKKSIYVFSGVIFVVKM